MNTINHRRVLGLWRRHARGRTVRAVAQESNISATTARRIIHGYDTVSLRTLLRLTYVVAHYYGSEEMYVPQPELPLEWPENKT